ncbi:cupin domain-containing protein [Picrophilus oshimae]|uniref:Mannose-6-phosphate isomerase n=1 Tax=Picrophilus torridus (strain ATCC 700027 / DSM 9790 / JCM 10055 / NBRC 100828 / KAW 2/3) TaxID=1122961 RepID=Q6L0H8_PICTO|nr:cupin domain-containing protein [Picrophilus oshimae]AAT43524.1 mannose-6-phosphate isomerase [Picrophilus oshimae DSM 9789]
MRSGAIEDVKADDVKFGTSHDVKIRWLVTKDDVKDYAVRKFTVKPNGLISHHYHKYVETLIILNGICRICVENKKMDLKRGDYIFVDTMEKHEIMNPGDTDLEFICVINYPEDMSIKTIDKSCFD